jgi:hypothetical protein
VFLDFSPHGVFMGIITTFHVVVFSLFSHMILGVFAQSFVIYIFKFFIRFFSKIIFILNNVEVLKKEYYKTYVS